MLDHPLHHRHGHLPPPAAARSSTPTGAGRRFLRSPEPTPRPSSSPLLHPTTESPVMKPSAAAPFFLGQDIVHLPVHRHLRLFHHPRRRPVPSHPLAAPLSLPAQVTIEEDKADHHLLSCRHPPCLPPHDHLLLPPHRSSSLSMPLPSLPIGPSHAVSSPLFTTSSSSSPVPTFLHRSPSIAPSISLYSTEPLIFNRSDHLSPSLQSPTSAAPPSSSHVIHPPSTLLHRRPVLLPVHLLPPTVSSSTTSSIFFTISSPRRRHKATAVPLPSPPTMAVHPPSSTNRPALLPHLPPHHWLMPETQPSTSITVSSITIPTSPLIFLFDGHRLAIMTSSSLRNHRQPPHPLRRCTAAATVIFFSSEDEADLHLPRWLSHHLFLPSPLLIRAAGHLSRPPPHCFPLHSQRTAPAPLLQPRASLDPNHLIVIERAKSNPRLNGHDPIYFDQRDLGHLIMI